MTKTQALQMLRSAWLHLYSQEEIWAECPYTTETLIILADKIAELKAEIKKEAF